LQRQPPELPVSVNSSNPKNTKANADVVRSPQCGISSTNVQFGPKIALSQRVMGNNKSLIFRIDSKSENLFEDEVRLMSQQLRQNVGFRLSY